MAWSGPRPWMVPDWFGGMCWTLTVMWSPGWAGVGGTEIDAGCDVYATKPPTSTMRRSAAAPHHSHGPTLRPRRTTTADRPGLYLSCGRSTGGGAIVLVGAGAGANAGIGAAAMVGAKGAGGGMAIVLLAACSSSAA